MSYTQILDNITVGTHTKYAATLNDEQAGNLLRDTIKRLSLQPLKNNSYGNDRYFVYVASFPALHIAIDNKAGTTRLYSITTQAELNEIPHGKGPVAKTAQSANTVKCVLITGTCTTKKYASSLTENATIKKVTVLYDIGLWAQLENNPLECIKFAKVEVDGYTALWIWAKETVAKYYNIDPSCDGAHTVFHDHLIELPKTS